MKADGLWQYALTVYARPQVSATCLALQDGQGVNVCVLLTVTWLAEQGRDCQPALPGLLSCAASWDAAILPLRTARRALRSRSEMLYTRAKQLELAAERQLLAALATRVEPASLPALPPSQALKTNLGALAAHYGVDIASDADWQRLRKALRN